MMNVFANVSEIFNLLPFTWGDTPLPNRGDIVNLEGFLTPDARLQLAKQDANSLWPNRGYEKMSVLDAIGYESWVVVRRHYFRDVCTGEVDIWLSIRQET